MEREVRYCTTEDGVRIAYCIEGEGPPLLVSPYFFEAFSRSDRVPAWREFLDKLSRGRTLIRYDERGTGLSDRDPADVTNSAFVRDMAAVVDTARLDGFSLFAMGVSGARALEFAAGQPAGLRKLVVFGGWCRISDVMSDDALTGLAAMCRTNWPMAAQMFADMSLRRMAPDVGIAWGEQTQASINGETLARVIEAGRGLDLTDRLASINVATLILHRVDDEGVVPLSAAQRIAAGIPRARFGSLTGIVNWPAIGDVDGIVDAAHAFLDEDPETRRLTVSPRQMGQETTRDLRTVLFTDLVAHTEMMSRLGDERGRAVLREHERITREVLKSHGGTEVKTMGDGFMASFGSVTKAVECAIALQKAFAERANPDVGARRPFLRDASAPADPGAAAREPSGERHASPQTPPSTPDASTTSTPPEPLSVRVGLNAGEPIEEDGDLFGATVILASRIAAKAGGGEILVADTVRGLCSGKGFLFADRGEFAAKGFEDPVRVYEVRWRE